MRETARLVLAGLATTAVSTPTPAAGGAGDWVSRDNGPTNARRALGQALMVDWQERWSSPRGGQAHVLVKDGIVVFQDDPAGNFRRFNAVDLQTGTPVWEQPHLTGETDHGVTAGCVAGDRVFFPLSNEGSGNPPHFTQRVEAVVLSTGEQCWTWGSGVIGTLRALTPVPDSGGGHRVLASAFDNPTMPFNPRIVSLDAAAPCGAAPAAVESPISPGDGWMIWPSAYTWAGAGAGAAWKVLAHEFHRNPLPVFANWKSCRMPVYDLVDLAYATEPFDDAPALSCQTPSTDPFTRTSSPVVVDAEQAFLYETGGILHAYDLNAGSEPWSLVLSPDELVTMIPMVFSDRLVMINRPAGTITAYARTTGQELWSIEGPPDSWGAGGWCVLDGDVALIRSSVGGIHTLTAAGELSEEPIVTVPGLTSVLAAGGHFVVMTPDEVICYGPAPCFEVLDEEITCYENGETFTYTVEGLNSCTGASMTLSFTGSGGEPGEDFCFTAIINDEQGGFCCSTQICVPVPDCSLAACPCDLDGNDVVGATDLLTLLAAWGPGSGQPADFDGDGEVGTADLLELLAHWGPCDP